MPYPSALAQDMPARPLDTRQAHDRELRDKAKSGRLETLAYSIVDDMTNTAYNILWFGRMHRFDRTSLLILCRSPKEVAAAMVAPSQPITQSKMT